MLLELTNIGLKSSIVVYVTASHAHLQQPNKICAVPTGLRMDLFRLNLFNDKKTMVGRLLFNIE